MRIDLAGLSDTDRQAFLSALSELDPPLSFGPTNYRHRDDSPVFDYLDAPWRQEAACKELDSNLFFPGPGASKHRIQAAKNVCRVCPVITECLDYALETGSHGGIWGGMVERERQNARRRRQRQMNQGEI